MSQSYSLINQIRHLHEQNEQKRTKYQQYNITVEGNDTTILIPVDLCEQFERDVSSYKRLNEKQLNTFLVYYNGIKEK